MTDVLLMAVPSLALFLAMLCAARPAGWALVVAPLGGVLAALAVPVGSTVSLPWLLLGVHWQLDEIGRLFLLFSSLEESVDTADQSFALSTNR